MQIGCRRAGWYSYDLLDNGGQPSAERILPEHQSLQVGDLIPFVPKGDFSVPVTIIQPERAIVLGGKVPDSPDLSVSWGFVLLAAGEGRSRLISRWRAVWKPSLLPNFVWGIMTEAIGFVMDRKMLLGIKRRAETIPTSF